MHMEWQERSVSPVPSCVSLKSDRSMKMPINYDGENIPPDDIVQQGRSGSPVPSCVSMKSDNSMKMPINLQDGDIPLDESVQQDRSVSPVPSCVSMKSDNSMKMPINLQDGDIPLDESYTSMKNEISPNETGDAKEIQDNGPVPGAEVQKMLKAHLMKKSPYMSEALAKQGKQTLLKSIYTEVYITDGVIGHIHHQHEVRLIERRFKKAGTDDILIKCNNIFKPTYMLGQDKPIRIVLTKGTAGIGKTVSVQKFILDWAEGEANQDIHFIFPLPFRELNLMKDHKGSLMDLLHFFFAEIKALNSSEIENCKAVFIFDGLDECRLPLDFQNNKILCDVTESASVDVLLTNLIKGNLLPSALIWITSRPAAASQIPPEYVSRVTEIRGFNDPQKEEYFRKRISDQNMASGIISHIKSLRSLFIMCHIPVFCWISATVLERMLGETGSAEIPRTLTQMYTHFLIIQIKIIREKYTESKETDKDIIFKLGRLAFEQLGKGNLIFYEEDLRECGIEVREASVYSGVFTQIFREECGLYQRKVYCFVHLSIQEHLAALYVFLSFCNNNTNVLEHQPNSEDGNQNKTVKLSDLHKSAVDKASESVNGHLDLFLRFLLGLSMESNQILLRDMLTQSAKIYAGKEETVEYVKHKIRNTLCSERCVVYFNCLVELEDHSLIEEMKQYLHSASAPRLPQKLWAAFVFMLLTSEENLDVFDVRKYGISDTVSLMIHPVIKASTKALMSNCGLTEKTCAILTTTFTPDSSLKELDLSHNDLQDSGVKLLCTGMKHVGYTLKSIIAELIEKNGGAHPSISSSLQTQPNEVSSHELKHSMSEPPTAGLEDPECKLETLSLQNCGLTEKSCAYLASALKSNPSHLKSLDLSLNNLGDSGVKLLSDVLKDTPCKLEELTLSECNLTEGCCSALASVLSSKSSSLRQLDLSNNSVKDSGLKLMLAGLEISHSKLESLRLHNCEITSEGCSTLALAVRSTLPLLKELNLTGNEAGHRGAKLLLALLEDPQCELETLNIDP